MNKKLALLFHALMENVLLIDVYILLKFKIIHILKWLW